MTDRPPSTVRQRIPMMRKIALGAGDFGVNIYWQIASLFLLFFYTDVLGLSAYAAGLIYMSALIWDALVDPLIGALADRTRTRLGRFRPYLLLGALPLAAAFVLMFLLPRGEGLQLLALTAATHLAFRTLFALVSVPYASLYARVTRSSEERATMAGIRMVFAILAAMVVSALTLPAVRYFGGGTYSWGMVTALFAGAACVMLWIAALAAGTGDACEEETPADTWPGMRYALTALLLNRPLLLMLGVALMNSFAGTFFSKNLLYYFKYVRNDADFGGTALALMAVVAALVAPVWAQVARRYSKRFALLLGTAFYGLGFALWYLCSAAGYAGLMVVLTFIAIGVSANAVCFWAMIPDTVEYGQWRSGIRTESLIVGTVIFAQKAALGLAAGALGIVLGEIGFVANSVQTPQTLHLLLATMSLAPLLGSVGVFLLAWAYPIGPAEHRRLLESLSDPARRESATGQETPPLSLSFLPKKSGEAS